LICTYFSVIFDKVSCCTVKPNAQRKTELSWVVQSAEFSIPLCIEP